MNQTKTRTNPDGNTPTNPDKPNIPIAPFLPLLSLLLLLPAYLEAEARKDKEAEEEFVEAKVLDVLTHASTRDPKALAAAVHGVIPAHARVCVYVCVRACVCVLSV